jgi:hypothetical protein
MIIINQQQQLITVILLCIISIQIIYCFEYTPLDLLKSNKFHHHHQEGEDNMMYYYRVESNEGSKFFSLMFSSCVGRIELYYSHCSLLDSNCDNGSEEWFPNSNHYMKRLTHEDINGYGQLPFSSNELCEESCNFNTRNVYYFGVKPLNTKVIFEVRLQYYEMYHHSIYMNLPNQHLQFDDSRSLLKWSAPNVCNTLIEDRCQYTPLKAKIRYIQYILPSNVSTMGPNLLTFCGIEHAKAVPVTVTNNTWIKQKQLRSNVVTVVGILDNTDHTLNYPLVYIPMHLIMDSEVDHLKYIIILTAVSVVSCVCAGTMMMLVIACSRRKRRTTSYHSI